MTDPATLLALAKRCEQAAGPDRELDAEIEACLTGRVTHPHAPGYTLEKQDAEWKLARLAESGFISSARRPARPYTASLDAAVTLVPEGYYWQVANGKRNHSEPQACADLFVAHGPNRGDMSFTVDAATPALALCAAALRARAAMAQPSSDT
jgi:hypothetical protein